MFERIFERHKAVQRHSQGPLCRERKQFLEHLLLRGASKHLLTHYATYLLPVVQSLCRKWPVTVTERQIQSAADRWEHRHGRLSSESKHQGRRNFVLVARAWFRFFGSLDTVRIRHAKELDQFVEYMRSERNLSAVTIRIRRLFVRRFFLWIESKRLTLRQVDASTIDRVLADQVKRSDLERISIHNYAFNLRSFLAYAEQRGWCTKGLCASVDPPRVYQAATPPAGPSWAAVMQLLRSLQGSDPRFIRDRAIVLLFAIYGFRASEVRRLSLDDIDWKARCIHLRRSKESCRTQEYPLVDSVRDALIRYLRYVRPRSTRREVFLTLCMPYQPLCNGAFWQIVRKRLKAISPELKHHGPHALRHACATRLLQQRVDMKSIGDFLGHRSPASTAIYAKVDLENLRRVAQFKLTRFV
jgi:site-specific recombinase XerD